MTTEPRGRTRRLRTPLKATGQQILDGAADLLYRQECKRKYARAVTRMPVAAARPDRHRTGADATNAPYLAADSAGLAPPPGSPITRKVGVG